MSLYISAMSGKGGVGKSTITTNLASAMRETAILDTDEQTTCIDWGISRQKTNPPIIYTPSGKIHFTAKDIDKKYFFIDTASAANAALIEVAKASSLCLIVLCPAQFEMNALGKTVNLLKAINAKAIFCINKVDPNANISNLCKELSEYYPVGPILRDRKEYKQAASLGLGVTELKKENKASQELKNYIKWMKQWLI